MHVATSASAQISSRVICLAWGSPSSPPSNTQTRRSLFFLLSVHWQTVHSSSVLYSYKKKSLFSQCIPTGTLQKCFFYWSCRPDVCDCACLSVSVWKNKMSSLVRAGAFFFTACSLACANGCHRQRLSQIRPPVDASLCFLHSSVFVSSLERPARGQMDEVRVLLNDVCVRTSAAL